MRFARPPRRRPSEGIVPMINVVFLLLIFFMMAARITPPQPFDLTPPSATSDTSPEQSHILHLSRDGVLAFETYRDADVWSALSQAGQTGPLTLRADMDMPAPLLAETLGRLAAIGISDVNLTVRVK